METNLKRFNLDVLKHLSEFHGRIKDVYTGDYKTLCKRLLADWNSCLLDIHKSAFQGILGWNLPAMITESDTLSKLLDEFIESYPNFESKQTSDAWDRLFNILELHNDQHAGQLNAPIGSAFYRSQFICEPDVSTFERVYHRPNSMSVGAPGTRFLPTGNVGLYISDNPLINWLELGQKNLLQTSVIRLTGVREIKTYTVWDMRGLQYYLSGQGEILDAAKINEQLSFVVNTLQRYPLTIMLTLGDYNHEMESVNYLFPRAFMAQLIKRTAYLGVSYTSHWYDFHGAGWGISPFNTCLPVTRWHGEYSNDINELFYASGPLTYSDSLMPNEMIWNEENPQRFKIESVTYDYKQSPFFDMVKRLDTLESKKVQEILGRLNLKS